MQGRVKNLELGKASIARAEEAIKRRDLVESPDGRIQSYPISIADVVSPMQFSRGGNMGRLLGLARSAKPAVLVILSLVVPSALAADLATTQQALTMIAEFADRLCQSPPLSGGTQGVELTGTAKAELNEIISRIARLGVEGAAKYQNDHYQGLLQKDLANALKDSTNCRLKVWEDLKDKLIPAEPKASQPRNPPAHANSSKAQSVKDEFLLAGMRISCNIPISFSPNFIAFRDSFPNPGSRDAAAAGVIFQLINSALEKGDVGVRYECTFDDDAYYTRVVPLEPKPIARKPRCRAYQQTMSNETTKGKRITSERRACVDDEGYWMETRAPSSEQLLLGPSVEVRADSVSLCVGRQFVNAQALSEAKSGTGVVSSSATGHEVELNLFSLQLTGFTTEHYRLGIADEFDKRKYPPDWVRITVWPSAQSDEWRFRLATALKGYEAQSSNDFGFTSHRADRDCVGKPAYESRGLLDNGAECLNNELKYGHPADKEAVLLCNRERCWLQNRLRDGKLWFDYDFPRAFLPQWPVLHAGVQGRLNEWLSDRSCLR